MKVIFYYSNGETYTLNNTYLDDIEWWEGGGIAYLSVPCEVAYGGFDDVAQYLSEDTLAVVLVDEDVEVIHKNPNIRLSVQTDIMSARKRSKENNWCLYSRPGNYSFHYTCNTKGIF